MYATDFGVYKHSKDKGFTYLRKEIMCKKYDQVSSQIEKVARVGRSRGKHKYPCLGRYLH